MFEWNPDKAARNLSKHGIGFKEAITVFDDTLHITLLDEAHSQDENRYVTIGMSNQQRLLLVAHTDRNELIRIISARKATQYEEQFYRAGL